MALHAGTQVATSVAPTADLTFQTLTLTGAAASPRSLTVSAIPTIASSAGAVWNGVSFTGSTATLSGVTNVTTATGFNFFNLAIPALVGTVTVTNSATVYIAGAPSISGGGAITNPYALWVDAGNARFDEDITVADTVFASGGTSSISFSVGASTAIRTAGGAGQTTYMDLGTALFRDSNGASSGVVVSVYGNINAITDGSVITLGASSDVILSENAAAVLALKNGTTAQTLRVYGTTTGPKYAALYHDGTNAVVEAQAGSLNLIGASAQAINFYVGASLFWQIGGSGRLIADANYGFSHGVSALATTATEGYFHLNSAAGALTGVPASIPTGQIPMAFDTTNGRLYVYYGAAWHYIAITA